MSTPIITCPHCGEEIRIDESAADGAWHHECLIRSIAGSAAHQLHECTCYGGTREDPPGMTPRQAAKLAYETFLVLKEMGA